MTESHSPRSDPRWTVFEQFDPDGKIARVEAELQRIKEKQATFEQEQILIKQLLGIEKKKAEDELVKKEFSRALDATLDEMAEKYEPLQVKRTLEIFCTKDGMISYNTFVSRMRAGGYLHDGESLRHAIMRLIKPYQDKYGLDGFASLAAAATLTGLLCLACSKMQQGVPFAISDFILKLKTF